MSYEQITYTVQDGIAEIVLNRPDVLNAFDEDMIAELNDALSSAHADNRVYVILLTGEGRGFCSGANVDAMGERDPDKLSSAVRLWKVQNVVSQLYRGKKPTIAAVNGPAIGAGCDFALACDLRIMSRDAILREQFVNIGIVPGDGGGWLLSRLVGEAKAKEFVLTGEDITPEVAEDIGLVRSVVPSEETRSAGRELAATIRDKPAMAVRHSKHLVDAGLSFDEYMQAAREAQWDCWTDSEHDEAVAALRGGRDPDFDRPY